MQYSDQLLDHVGGPKLSQLTSCGAVQLPTLDDYLDVAAWNMICGSKYVDASLNNLILAYLRQTNIAVRQYEIGRANLDNYVAALSRRSHRLRDYLNAIEAFEHCVNAVWKAIELGIKQSIILLGKNHPDARAFVNRDGSIAERINKLNGVAKHWSAEQAAGSHSAPLWITNTGLECDTAEVSFDDLRTVVMDLNENCRWEFVERPKLSRLKVESSLVDSVVTENSGLAS
jgi:hypothetical protein